MSESKPPVDPPRDAGDPPATPRHAERSWKRWIVPTIALALTLVSGVMLFRSLQAEVWSYFTDDQQLRVEAQENRHRMVLWEDPRQSTFDPGAAADQKAPAKAPGREPGRVEAAFSPDGTAMVLTRWSTPDPSSEPRADLYLSRWNGRTWSRPEPLTALNTPSNERGAAFSPKGDELFFSSDRPGGAGGYDIYVARVTGNNWSAPQRLGEAVNTPGNETGPAPARSDDRLFFTSDRDGGAGAQDIYVAQRLRVEQPAPEAPPQTPAQAPADQALPAPVYADAQPVSPLNSTADDIEAAQSDRGGYVFLASNRGEGDKAGFKLFLSRVVNGQAAQPEQVDLYIDEANVTDPAVRMDGFDLLFSSDARQAGQPPEDASGYQLYQSTTREVVGYTDFSQWESFKGLINRIAWWLLLAVAAIIALVYMAEKWQDITSLFHKCLAGSAMVHLLILLLMMFWFISQEISSGGQEQSPEVVLSIDALAQEDLALESEQALAQIAHTAQLVVTKIDAEFREVELNPANIVTNPVTVVRQSSPQSLVSDVRLSAASESQAVEPLPQPDQTLPALTALSPTELPGLEVSQLEVQVASEDKPVDLTRDDFKPDPTAVQSVEVQKLVLAQVASPQLDVRSDSTAAPRPQDASASDTGGQTVNPTDGLEATQQQAKLDGSSTAASLAANLPGSNPFDAIPRGEKLETPKHQLDPKALLKYMELQRGKPDIEAIELRGGSKGTEQAVGLGLDWFTNNQEPDGHWDMAKHDSVATHNTAGAGLALLCYYGWGIKHGQANPQHEHARHIRAATRALDWLLKQQKPDGDLRGSGQMYSQGIATIALCEAYALTKDPALREPATRAIQFIVKAQHKSGGGWRYAPGQAGDLSVTSWQVMALHSARLAGIDVPQQAFDDAGRFLDAMSFGQHGGLYGYNMPGSSNLAMTSTGMFLRQLGLEAPTQPRMIESAQYIKANMIKPGRRRFYDEYYATLALYQHQGPIWHQWNETLKRVYIESQVTDGEHAGSWDPKQEAQHARAGGRVTTTALAVLSLEVYYRFLPLYGFSDRDQPAAP